MTRESLERLRRGELAADELMSALRHVGSCTTCATLGEAELTSDIAGLQQTVRDAPEDEHPDAETALIPFVDGTLDPATREIVESHLEDCEQCRAEVADLRAFAKKNMRPERNWTWLAIAAALAVLIAIGVMVSTRPTTMSNTPPHGTVSTQTPPVEPPIRPPYANARWETLVSDALVRGRLPFPGDLAALRGSADSLRGPGGDERPLLSPAGVVLDETRPRFSWPSIPNATYVVSVFENDNRIAQSEPLRQTEWAPSRDLPRGRTLVWQVEATHDGVVDYIPAPPAPQAKFRIAGEREHADLVEAKRAYPDDPLLLAVLYARAGLRDEALRELRRVDLARHPDAKRLIDQSLERGDPTSTDADQ